MSLDLAPSKLYSKTIVPRLKSRNSAGTELYDVNAPLSIGFPRAGWVDVSVQLPEAECVRFAASYTPRDSLTDMVNTCIALLDAPAVPSVPHMVNFNLEPGRRTLTFVTHDRSSVQVTVAGVDEPRSGAIPQLVCQGAVPLVRLLRSVLATFAELKRSHDSPSFFSEWRHPFPERELEQLKDMLRRWEGAA